MMRQLTALTAGFCLAMALLAAAPGCQKNGDVAAPKVKVQAEDDVPTGPPFYQDVTAQTGVDFTYRSGEEAGHYAILESLGGGVGVFDFDNDGLLDLFTPGGGYYDGPDKKQIKGHPCKLYKNLGDFKFKDVTAEAGLERTWPYTHGCAVGDYDNDGFLDLLVTGWGGVLLFHNVPADPKDPAKGRKFVDVTRKAGVTDPRWSTSAGWADFDADGFADLYICHYVDWSFDNDPVCQGYTRNVPRDVCPPGQFKGLPDVIYRNNGDGTFTDMSLKVGLVQTPKSADQRDAGKGLGVVLADFNLDGRPDIYVANDTVDNFLYLNRATVPKEWKFEEIAGLKGVARDESGVPQGSMGLDVADYDRSGLPSIFVTNYENEMHALYRNSGNESFLFSTPIAGIAAIGQRYVGFGTYFIDLDHDGWKDLVFINGHVIRHPARAGLAQRPVVFHNYRYVDAEKPERGRQFKAITPRGGDYFQKDHRGRGLALGDLDNDGWPDLVVSHVNEPLAILKHQGAAHEKRNHWLGFELVPKAPRDLVGARVVVQMKDRKKVVEVEGRKTVVELEGRKLTSFHKGGASYLSTADPRHWFGLGEEAEVKAVRVVWPGGTTQEWSGEQFTADRYYKLREAVDERQRQRGEGVE
jgi:enediyne biosynthesis protein E4